MADEDIKNGRALMDSGYVPKTAQESLATEILERIEFYRKKGYSMR